MTSVMKVAVIQFPGSNCDTDCQAALSSFPGVTAEIVWHKETSLAGYDAIVLPGGFSYGDYLRCGSIARFSPIMGAVRGAADAGVLVLGICNGFQILCEAGLLPGALIRNRELNFLCQRVHVRVEDADTIFTNRCRRGDVLDLPIKHGEGCYVADEATLRTLEAGRQIVLRYTDAEGRVTPEANPNGSLGAIAGIRNAQGNVFGLMPHPEHACEWLVGGEDGRKIFLSIIASGGGAAEVTPALGSSKVLSGPEGAGYRRYGVAAWSDRRGVRAHRGDGGAYAHFRGARGVLGDVVGTLQLQELAGVSPRASHERAACSPGPG